MKKLIAIGEALIDFIPGSAGKSIQHTESFQPVVGGAPANVCGAFTRLGGESFFISQLGNDPFGDKIVEELSGQGIDCGGVKRTSQANTSLAFVALKEEGNREFSFYRKPGADMLLAKEDVMEQWFQDVYALHFCSVSLGNFPMKEAHRQAIEFAKKNKAIVSFDPNLRPALWESKEAMLAAVQEFLPMADIVKISDEEIEQITGEKVPYDGIEKLLNMGVKLVIYTMGSQGAQAYNKNGFATVKGIRVNAVDTTGAGDAFIGSFLNSLWRADVKAEALSDIKAEVLEEMLTFSNRYCAKSVLGKGAIRSYPTWEEMQK